MVDFDVISLSSDSSRPSSPFINVSEVFNDSEKHDQFLLSRSDETETVSKCVNLSPVKNRIVHTLSESDESESESVPCSSDLGKHNNSETNRLYVKYSALRNCQPTLSEDLDDSFCNVPNQLLPPKEGGIKAKINKQNHGLNTKLTKEQRQEDKLRKQREKDQKKAEKLAAKELQNHMKPGNCIKYMSVILDSSLVTSSFSGILIAAIQNSEAKYQINTHTVPNTVLWKRELPGMIEKQESDLVVIWEWQTVIPAIKNHTLCTLIQDIQTQNSATSIYLIIYGLNGYFSYLKSKRRNNNSGDKPKRRRKESDEYEYPYVTKKEIEEELIELQIMTNCNHRLIESPEELGQIIVQITKAIAETPFKLDKQRRELESLEWFAVGDSRDCVTVDKAGNGLLRLWQQQLCQFNMAGHDVAQAIAAVYPSPQTLVKAYDKCISKIESEELLKDIPVRRCQGPLSSSRRIGPELSKKICTFFCSSDGESPLSQEQ